MTKGLATPPRPALWGSLFLCCLTTCAGAEVLSFNDPSIIENLCVGSGCGNPEGFSVSFNQVEVKADNTRILFEDTSGFGYAGADWAIQANEPLTTGEDQLMFLNATSGAEILTIKGGAPASTMVLSGSGRVGLGTELPQADLHVVSGGTAKIRMQESNSGANWEINVGGTGIGLYAPQAFAFPFFVENGAPNNAFWIEETGHVGIGTSTPSAPFEVSDGETFSYFRITAEDAAVNQSVDIVFTEGPLGTGQLRYNIVDGDAQEMSLDADGNMILSGALTTGGPGCVGGCDAVFTERQIIPAEDYAAQMWANGHLPHVGPTAPGEKFNMTEKMGGMLNALEHAHIYIEALRAQNAALEARIALLEAAAE